MEVTSVLELTADMAVHKTAMAMEWVLAADYAGKQQASFLSTFLLKKYFLIIAGGSANILGLLSGRRLVARQVTFSYFRRSGLPLGEAILDFLVREVHA
jgi:hypothetical protein